MIKNYFFRIKFQPNTSLRFWNPILVLVFVFFSVFTHNLYAQTNATSIRSDVNFEWDAPQNANNDPLVLRSIRIGSLVYDIFERPTGYELTQLGPAGNAANNILDNGVEVETSSASPTWGASALTAYQDRDLNHFFESNGNGQNICNNFGAVAGSTAQKQTLIFDNIVTSASSIIGFSERNANNCSHIEIFGIGPGESVVRSLGQTFIQANTTQWGYGGTGANGSDTGTPGAINPPPTGTDYWLTNRVVQNGGTLGIALFDLEEIVPIGSIITSVRTTAASVDVGDGQVFIMDKDYDDDGVDNIDDLDDDNDGILDVDERNCFNTTPRAANDIYVDNSVTNESDILNGQNSAGAEFNAVNDELVIDLGGLIPGGTEIILDYFASTAATKSILVQQSNFDGSVTSNNVTITTNSNAATSLTYTLNADTKYIRLLMTVDNGGVLEVDYLEIQPYQQCLNIDTDGDLLSDHFDRDTDGDGCPDALEGNGGFDFSQLDSRNALETDTSGVDINGVPNLANGGQANISSKNAGVQSTICGDRDGDGIGNDVDIDDDNDGILDTVEDGCFAEGFSNVSGVTNPSNILGAVDGSVATWTTNGNIMTIDFGEVYPAGTRYSITWRRRAGESGTAQMILRESALETSGYVDHPNAPQVAQGAFETDVVAANTSFRYLQITKETNPSITDFDVDSISVSCATDSDGDGVLDRHDLDSDNDGIPDIIEAQSTLGYAAPDDNDADNDGLDDVFDATPNGSSDGTGSQGLTPEDTDGTGDPDYLDLDSDDDGAFDIVEGGAILTDANDDGRTDGNIGGNGLDNTLEANDNYNDVNGSYDDTQADNFTDADNDVNSGGDVDYRDADSVVPEIIAQNDSVTAESGLAIIDIINVLDNDLYDGAQASTGNVTVTEISSDDLGITVGTDGTIDLAANLAGGIYFLTYQICQNGVPSNCDTATVTVTITGDQDGDGIPDDVDIDDDNDGVLDTIENGGDDSCFVEAVESSTGVTNPNNILGADDGIVATWGTNGNIMTIDFGEVYPAGTQYQIIWKRVAGASGTAIMILRESTAPSSGFVDHPAAPEVAQDAFETDIVTANTDFRYLQITKEANPSSTDFEIDAINVDCVIDTDDDGIRDSFDLDSDNDGIPDNIEAQSTLGYVSPADNDADGDGLDDAYDDTPNGNANGAGSNGLAPVDTDGIGEPDYKDVDSDEDGIFDIDESGSGLPDNDNSGQTDNSVGFNGLDNSLYPADDYVDVRGGFDATQSDNFNDSDGDVNSGGDVDYRDDTFNVNTDNDNDGIPDSVDIDDDNDGILDVIEFGSQNLSYNFTNMSTIDSRDRGAPNNLNRDFIFESGTGGVDNYTFNLSFDTNTSVIIETTIGDQDTPRTGTVTVDGTSENFNTSAGVFQTVSHSPGTASSYAINISGTDASLTNIVVRSASDSSIILAQFDFGTNTSILESGYTRVSPNSTSGTISAISLTDADNDGIPDYLDLDSDNDGIPDNIEAQTTLGYIAADDNDADNDGLDDAYDATPNGNSNGSGSNGLTPENTDGADNSDYLDLDSDDDGLFDIDESGSGLNDANDDGRTDNSVGLNGFDDSLETIDNYASAKGDFDDTQSDNFTDADSDVNSGGDVDYRDDSFDTDTDGDGITDDVDIDDDNDGILDEIEGECFLESDPVIDGFDSPLQPNVNANNFVGSTFNGWTTENGSQINVIRVDGTGYDRGPDLAQSGTQYIDIADADDLPVKEFIVEQAAYIDFSAYFSNRDINQPTYQPWTARVELLDGDDNVLIQGNGISFTAADGDEEWIQSGITNYYLSTPGTYKLRAFISNNGHGDTFEFCISQDSDGDGIVDSLDLDSDNDGLPDNIEAQPTLGYNPPANNDADNDGLDDAYDATPNGNSNGSGSNGLTPENTDGTGEPDFLDLDADDDGLFDIDESGDGITDADDDGRTDGTVGINGLDNTVDSGGVDDYSDINGKYDDTQDDNFNDTDGDVNSGGDVDYRDDTFNVNDDNDNDGIPNSVDIDDDNDGIIDTVENNCVGGSATSGRVRYQFFDFEPTSNTVDNIPSESSATDIGFVSDFDVDALYTSITPGDGDTFSIRYLGRIEISTTENYTFYTSSDDGSSLSINGVEIVDNDGPHAVQEQSGTINLTPGFYDLEVLYFENGGDETLTVSYSSPSITKQEIPFAVLDDGIFEGCDLDGDGIINSFDLDSDNDGIPDNIEAQTTLGYVDPDGNDSDNDGLDDAYDDTPNGNSNGTGSNGLVPEDTDGVGEPDYKDLDSDEDGLFDIDESGSGLPDNNNDGQTDGTVGVNGLDNILESNDDYASAKGDFDDTQSDNFTDADSDVNSGGDVDYRDDEISSSVIIANNDSAIHQQGTIGNDIVNVLDNDTVDGIPATPATVTITTLSSDSTGITLDSNGNIDVAASVADGVYQLEYQICQTSSPSNCDTAIVDVLVGAGDNDGDGIPDDVDIDDDNDGILDTEENPFNCAPIGGQDGYTEYLYNSGVATASNMIFSNIGTQAGTSIDMRITTISGAVTYNTNGNADCAGPNGFAINSAGTGDIVRFEFLESGTNIPIVLNNFALFMDDFDDAESIQLELEDLVGYAFATANPFAFSTTSDYLNIDSNDNNADEFLFYYSRVSTFDIVFTQATERNFCFSTDDDGIDYSTFTCVTQDPNASGGLDSDGDGLTNEFDLDSDNDGIPDNIEAQSTTGYVAPDYNDADNDGLDDAYDATPNGNANGNGSLGLTPVNTDGAGDSPDYLDLDSDDDGLFDIDETGEGLTDANDDGRTDNNVGINGLDNTVDDGGNDDYTDVNGKYDDTQDDNFDDADGDVNFGGDVDYRDDEVTVITITANNDNGAINEFTPNNSLLNVLNNDTVNGNPANIADVIISELTSTDPDISLNAATGEIIVGSNVEAGIYTLTYRICQSANTGNCDDGEVTIIVNEVLPTAVDDTATVNEDSVATSIDVTDNDNFGGDGPSIGTITLPSATSANGGTLTVNDNGTPNDPTDDEVNYTPAPDFNGTDTFDYTIEDANGDTSTGTVTVTVDSVDDAPTAVDDLAVVDEDSGVTSIDVTDNDDFGGDGPSNGTIILPSATSANGGTLTINDNGTPNDPTDDEVNYAPAADFNGVDTFDYTIEDADGDTSTATVTVAVSEVNDLPTAVDDTATVNEDSVATNIDVTDNDDFGGDGPSIGTITLPSATSANGGTLVVDDNGTSNDPTDDEVVYTPAPDFNGTDTFDYTIEDVDGDTSTATVTVTVNAVNDVPTAVDDLAVVDEDSGVTSIDVTDNDDFGGDGPSTGTITIPSATSANGGTLTINDNGTPNDPTDDEVNYTPAPDFNGVDTFNYTIEDADGDTSTATVTVAVSEVNDLPTAVDDTATVNEDSVATNFDVTDNDDFGGDGPNVGTITLPSATSANGATLVVDDNGTPNDPTDDEVVYTPAPNFNGTDTFDYTIEDADGDTSTATVTVTVNAVNDVPTAVDDTATLNEDSVTTNIDVTDNDDFGGDGPSIGTITLPSATSANGGTLTVNNNGTPNDPTDDEVVYTPAPDFNGTDTFDYTIEDADGDTSTATVTVTVNAVNDLPTAVDDTATVNEDSGATNIDVTDNDDFGGDGPSTGTITLPSATSANGGTLTVDDNGTPNDPTDDEVIYTPAPDFNGTDTFDYVIADADGDTSTGTVTVTVNAVNDLPVAVSDSITVTENSPSVNIDVTNNDDFGGDGPNVGTITLPSATSTNGGTLVLNDGGTPNDPTDDSVDYTPATNYFGTDTFDYTITDANGDTFTTTVSIVVERDTDNDGISDATDIDDDNDGIIDIVEDPATDEFVIDFNAGTQGWQTDTRDGNLGFNNGDSNPVSSTAGTVNGCNFQVGPGAGAVIPASPTGSNFIIETDYRGNETFLQNGSDLSQNVSSSLGGSLSFYHVNGRLDGRIAAQGANPTMDITLRGAGINVTTTIDATGFSDGVWRLITIDLDDATWSGSAANLSAVLADLDRVRIETETILDAVDGCEDREYMGLDDIRFNVVGLDSDNDSIPDYLDLDSDNDGIPDNVEGQPTVGYENPLGTDNDNDGLDDRYDADDNNPDPVVSAGITPQNTDSGNDTIPDYLDLDSDNDGFFDLVESGDNLNDSDSDGRTDDPVGDNGLDDDIDTPGNEDGYDDVNGIINIPSADLDDTDGDVNNGGDVDYRDIPLIDAVDDNTTAVEGVGGVGLINVLDNDTVDGVQATISNVDITQISTTNPGVTVDPVTGNVDVGASVPAGAYTIEYRICQEGITTNCDNAFVTVTVERDTDGDGVPDSVDIDDDDDGILDSVECGAGTILSSQEFNSGTAADVSSYSTNYSVPSGNDRIVVLVLGSEYTPITTGTTQNANVTLGGVAMTQEGINYGVAFNNNNNYLSVYTLPEASLSGVTNSTLSITATVTDQAFAGYIFTVSDNASFNFTSEFFDISPPEDVNVSYSSPPFNASLSDIIYMFANSGENGSTYNFDQGEVIANVSAAGSTFSGTRLFSSVNGLINLTGEILPARRSSGVIFSLATSCADSDGDGIEDFLDLDSDNDGIPDNVEGQPTIGYITPTYVDSDGDGLMDVYDSTPNGGADGSIGITPENTDETDLPDYLDLDSDNDGLFDLDESGDNLNDSDSDGRTDDPVGENGLDDNIDTPGNEDGYDDVNGIINTPSTDLDDTDGDVNNGGDVDYRDGEQFTVDMPTETVLENDAFTSVAPTLENAPAGTITYGLSGVDAGLFTIDANTGVVSMIARDFENPDDANANNFYNLVITAMSSTGGMASDPFSVVVNNVCEDVDVVANKLRAPDPIGVANSSDTAELQVEVTDAAGAARAGVQVTITLETGTASFDTPSSGTTDANGFFSATVSSTVVGTPTFSATYASGTGAPDTEVEMGNPTQVRFLSSINDRDACGEVGIAVEMPHPSSVLEVFSEDKGLLIPSVALLSCSDTATIKNPATSLLVYNTNQSDSLDVGFVFYDGAEWRSICLERENLRQ